MSCIVAIETSTEHCSVALQLHGELKVLRAEGVRQHAEWVLPMLAQLLAQAGLARSAIDVIGYGRGPGAFTGVRLAVAIAQGLGFALDRPTFGVSSLQACASAACQQLPGGIISPHVSPHVVAILDARMGEFYAAAYQCSHAKAPVLSGEECLLNPAALQIWLAAREPALAPIAFTGNGLTVLPAALFAGFPAAHLLPDIRPDAETIAKLTAAGFAANQAVAARYAQPAYVRDKVADTLIERAAKSLAVSSGVVGLVS